MIVLDASVLIAYLDGGDAHHAAAEDVLSTHSHDELRVSPLTLAEVLVGPARTGRLVEARDILTALGIADLAWPSDAVELARLRATTRVKLPDCVVLLGALETGAALATFDGRLSAAARSLELPTYGA